jgi:type I restriction enzyme, R subunit
VELKTDFTQSVEDAVDQYRFDRLPKPKGLTAEPLLSFPSGALVHFAVSNDEVRMTTKLAGPATIFLPFNKGDEGAAGNPPNLNGGHRTAYLWEEVCARESWLEILGRYLVSQKDSKKQIKSVIFPRYYQLDATRKLMASVFESGAGGKYLIQYSAGSGKTNSIAWSAHFLADLHDAQHKKVFDSVLVVSDRNVIDQQLQEAIFDFERTAGVVRLRLIQR